MDSKFRGFKASKTLLGIETIRTIPVLEPIRKIQSLQNPFRDWNTLEGIDTPTQSEIQSLQNPFRDWNIWLWGEVFKG